MAPRWWAYVMPGQFGPLWCVWLAGAAAYGLERQRVLQGRGAVTLRLGSSLAIVAYVAAGHGSPSGVVLPLIGLMGMVFLASGRQGEGRLSRPLDARLAAFSYSFYAIHLQLMAGTAALLVRCGVLPLTGLAEPAKVVVLAFAMTGLSVAIAYLFGRMFESRAPVLARHLRRWVRLSGSDSPSSRSASARLEDAPSSPRLRERAATA